MVLLVLGLTVLVFCYVVVSGGLRCYVFIGAV